MRLCKLEVKGYRSLKDVSWRPTGLNLLIGPNGSGKTNLIRLLELVASAAGGSLGKWVQREGGITPMLWDGRSNLLTIVVNTSYTLTGLLGQSERYELTLERIGSSGWYELKAESLSRIEPDGSTTSWLQRAGRKGSIFDARTQEMISMGDDLSPEETLLSMARTPTTVKAPATGFREDLSSWMILQDVRFDRSADIRRAVVSRHEPKISSDANNLAQFLHTHYANDKGFRSEIDEGMKAAFGDDFAELAFPPAGERLIELAIRWNSLNTLQRSPDLSDGTLRFLLLLAILADPAPPALLAIEEPELGLHPSMLPIVAEYAIEASKRRHAQVIFTTHSPEFLSALHDITPATTVFNLTNGATELRIVDGKELEYWLEEYSLGELHRSGQLESM
jgi:predicted ATPase